MSCLIKKIVVVGGGTAGWMSAAFLSSKGFEVTLVESPDIKPIVVGESALPSISRFLHDLGLSESDWMPKSNAVHKLGIKHVGWKPDSEWWHWFADGYNCNEDQIANFTPDDLSKLGCAYHLDTGKFSQNIIKPVAIKNGCVHVVDHIVCVELNNVGAIDYIVGRSGQQYKADYYFDCTGFSKILSRAVGTAYQPYVDSINDRIIMCSQPSLSQINNYTITYRKPVGWIWETALTNCRSTGYVYSSEHMTNADAIDEYCKHYPNTDKSKIKILNYTPEKCINPFNKNVVAVGLSSGFIDPLEATTLFLIQYTIVNVYITIVDNKISTSFNRKYSKLMDNSYMYMLAHYTLISDHSNEYWHHYKQVELKLFTIDTAKKLANQPDIITESMKQNHNVGIVPPHNYSWQAMLKGYSIEI